MVVGSRFAAIPTINRLATMGSLNSVRVQSVPMTSGEEQSHCWHSAVREVGEVRVVALSMLFNFLFETR